MLYMETEFFAGVEEEIWWTPVQCVYNTSCCQHLIFLYIFLFLKESFKWLSVPGKIGIAHQSTELKTKV